MRVLFYLKYNMDQATARVRGFHIAEELRKRNIDCGISRGFGKYFKAPLKIASYDIIYFQRSYFAIDILESRFARGLGKKTVFDIDDAPFGINYDAGKEKRAVRMIKTCSAVTVGSRRLRDFALKYNARVCLLPSSINLGLYKPRKKTKGGAVTLGWIGYGPNYKKDLLTLVKPLENIAARHDIRLSVVGALKDREIYRALGNIKNVPCRITDSLEWKNPFAVPEAIADFDIGLYPLLDNEYNRYKCGFKALEYMAMEIPVVASPVGENIHIVENGTDGLLASTEKEWEGAISALIEDGETRERLARNGRRKVERQYSTRICAERLIGFLEEINNDRRHA